MDYGHPQQRYPEQQYPEQQYPEQQYPEQRYPEQRYPQGQYAQEQYSQEHYPQEQYPREQYPQEQYPQNGDYGHSYQDNAEGYDDGYGGQYDGTGYDDGYGGTVPPRRQPSFDPLPQDEVHYGSDGQYDRTGYDYVDGDAVSRSRQASFDPQPRADDAAYGYDGRNGMEIYPGGEAGPPARAPFQAVAPAPSREGAAVGNPKKKGDKFFSEDADFVGTEYPRPAPSMGYAGPPRPAPQYLAAAEYASMSKSPSLSSSSTAHAPSVASSATYAVSSATYAASSPSVPKGRTLLKDRYNPNGPLEDNGPDAYFATGRGGKRRRGGSKKCCCIFCVVLLLLIGGLVAAFFLLFKQPDVRFLGVEQPPGGQPGFSADQLKFSMNFQLKVGVKNPNILGITFSNVEGEARFKDISPTVVGSGNLRNVEVPKNSDQVVLFPFTINYDPVFDPGSKILLYVAKSCGLLGGTKGKLDIDYTIRFSINVLSSLGIKPAFTSTASFDCPLASGQTLPIGGLGNVGSLIGSTNNQAPGNTAKSR